MNDLDPRAPGSGGTGPDLPSPLAAVIDLMREYAQDIAEETADRVIGEIPTYLRVPRDSLVQSALRHNARAVSALATRQAIGPEEVDDAWIATERVTQGVPVEDMLRAVRLVLSILRDRFIDWAFRSDMEPHLIVSETRLLWDLTDVVTRELATAHREEELEIARNDERQRVEFLWSLMSGSVSSPELHLRAAAFGLPIERTYVAFRARPQDGTELTQVLRAMTAWVTSTQHPALFAPIEGDLAGVSVGIPEIPEPVTVGVGAAEDLHNIVTSFRIASQALDVGVSFGYRGIVSPDRLSLHVAIASEHEVGDLMMGRYIHPLLAEDEFGIVLEQSVRAYLKADLNTAKAAKDLVVHPNTLRHRLRRFELITGANLASAGDVVEVWWALERLMWVRLNNSS